MSIDTHNMFSLEHCNDAFPAPSDVQIKRLDDLNPQQFGQLYAMVGFNDEAALRRLHRLGRFTGDTKQHHNLTESARNAKLAQFGTFMSMIEQGDFIVLPVGGAVIDRDSAEWARSHYVPLWYGRHDVESDAANGRETDHAYQHNNNPANCGNPVLTRWDKEGLIGAAFIMNSSLKSKTSGIYDRLRIEDGAIIVNSTITNCTVRRNAKVIDSDMQEAIVRSGQRIANNRRNVRGAMLIAAEESSALLGTAVRSILGLGKEALNRF